MFIVPASAPTATRRGAPAISTANDRRWATSTTKAGTIAWPANTKTTDYRSAPIRLILKDNSIHVCWALSSKCEISQLSGIRVHSLAAIASHLHFDLDTTHVTSVHVPHSILSITDVFKLNKGKPCLMETLSNIDFVEMCGSTVHAAKYTQYRRGGLAGRRDWQGEEEVGREKN